MRGVTKYSSFKEWASSPSPGKGGGGGAFLKNWKDKGECDTWMHVKCLPMTVWRHGFPEYVVVEDKKTKEKVKHVFNKRHTCHETEDVLDKMYWREEKGNPLSDRKHPPERCGQCKFVEWLWAQCWLWLETHSWDNDEKKWTENKPGKGKGIDPCRTIFRFKSEAEDKENVTITAGGACGLFKKDVDEDLKLAMRAHKIKGTEVWRENLLAKAHSVMVVVNDNDVKAGVQIAEEAKALGEKVKEQIVKTLKSSKGKRDIQKTPYCIKWEFHKDAEFDKKYDATAILENQPSPRILKLIRGPAPDLSGIETPFNQQTMRAKMEQHCLLKNVPWDEMFPTKEQEKKWAAEDEAASSEEEESEEEEDEESDDSDEEDSDDEMFECDECGKEMKASDKECPHCGHEYDVDEDEDDDEEEEEEEKPVKKKSSAKTSSKKSKKDEEEEEDEEDEDEDDDEEEEEEEKPVKKKSSAKTSSKKSSKSSDEDDEDEEEDEEEDEDEDEDEEEEEEEKPVKKKSSAKTSSKKSSAKISSKKSKKDDDDEDEEDDDTNQDDEIPF